MEVIRFQICDLCQILGNSTSIILQYQYGTPIPTQRKTMDSHEDSKGSSQVRLCPAKLPSPTLTPKAVSFTYVSLLPAYRKVSSRWARSLFEGIHAQPTLRSNSFPGTFQNIQKLSIHTAVKTNVLVIFRFAFSGTGPGSISVRDFMRVFLRTLEEVLIFNFN